MNQLSNHEVSESGLETLSRFTRKSNELRRSELASLSGRLFPIDVMVPKSSKVMDYIIRFSEQLHSNPKTAYDRDLDTIVEMNKLGVACEIATNEMFGTEFDYDVRPIQFDTCHYDIIDPVTGCTIEVKNSPPGIWNTSLNVKTAAPFIVAAKACKIDYLVNATIISEDDRGWTVGVSRIVDAEFFAECARVSASTSYAGGYYRLQDNFPKFDVPELVSRNDRVLNMPLNYGKPRSRL